MREDAGTRTVYSSRTASSRLFVFMQDAYLALYENNSFGTLPIVQYGIEHVNIPFALIVTAFYITFTILGCFWGKRIVAKHFKMGDSANNFLSY